MLVFGGHEDEKKKNSPRPKRTSDASSGPVFSVAVLRATHLVGYNLNKSPMAQATRLMSLGPVFFVSGLRVTHFVVHKVLCTLIC
jgi:hypothetical protein